MLEKYNRYRVLKVFLDSPTMEFGLRELSRIVRLAPVSVLNYLKEFEETGIIKKFDKKNKPVYKADRENESFILYKKLSIWYELHNSGLIEYLWQNLAPKAIILYGSYAKGEATENSDIDIFIIGKKKEIDISRFENIFNREIHLLFDSEFKSIPNELKNNLSNGIVLKGYLRMSK